MILIDEIRKNKNRNACPVESGKLRCHLYHEGKNIKELHHFAKKLFGRECLKWYDNRKGRKHYDITGEEALICILNGAKQKFYDKSVLNKK